MLALRAIARGVVFNDPGRQRRKPERQEDGSLVLFLNGELDMATAPMLARALNELVEPHTWSLMLDRGGLSFVDVVGLRALSEARRMAVSAGLLSRLRAVSDLAFRVIRLADHVELEAAIWVVPGASAA
jgi:anti-anti-sigma factor